MFMSLLYTGIGALMYKYPPKKINKVMGYRTTLSMKNDETWKFANIYSGKLLLYTGIGLLLHSILIPVLLRKTVFLDTFAIGFSFGSVLVLIIPVLMTEIALHNKFDKDGNPK